jgi:hypothetical protein
MDGFYYPSGGSGNSGCGTYFQNDCSLMIVDDGSSDLKAAVSVEVDPTSTFVAVAGTSRNPGGCPVQVFKIDGDSLVEIQRLWAPNTGYSEIASEPEALSFSDVKAGIQGNSERLGALFAVGTTATNVNGSYGVVYTFGLDFSVPRYRRMGNCTITYGVNESITALAWNKRSDILAVGVRYVSGGHSSYRIDMYKLHFNEAHPGLSSWESLDSIQDGAAEITGLSWSESGRFLLVSKLRVFGPNVDIWADVLKVTVDDDGSGGHVASSVLVASRHFNNAGSLVDAGFDTTFEDPRILFITAEDNPTARLCDFRYTTGSAVVDFENVSLIASEGLNVPIQLRFSGENELFLQGGSLDLVGLGGILLNEDAKLMVHGGKITGISSNNLSCATGSSLEFSDVIVFLSPDSEEFRFNSGRFFFQGDVIFCGGGSFRYSSGEDSVVRRASTLYFRDGIELKLDIPQSVGYCSPFLFEGAGSCIIFDNADIYVKNNILFHGGRIEFYNDVSFFPLSPAVGTVTFGSGVQGGDVELILGSSALLSFWVDAFLNSAS